MFKKYVSLFFLVCSTQYVVADYGWVQDLVGIEEESFNYVEGSDPDLEKYTKNAFFTNVTLSPNGKYLAFQSKSSEFTEGILIAESEKYFEKGLAGSTIAKIAVEGGADQDLGVRELFLCNALWASNRYILIELCGKRFDFVEGEIFVALGVFKIFDMETKEFRNFLYPLESGNSKGSENFQDRYKVATFISRYDDEHILMSIPENRRGYRYANLRKIKLDKRGTEARGDNIYVSKEPCQTQIRFRASNFCNQGNIFLLDQNKKPVLTFSSDLDGVYAHLADKETTKIDIDLEDYSPVAIKGSNLYMVNNSGLAPSAVSVFNIKSKKITRISPSDCSTVRSAYSSLNQNVPYAVQMECDGFKEIIYFDQESRDAQLLMNLSRSFPDKYISFGEWSDSNDKALLSVQDSSSYVEVFLLDLKKQKLQFVGTASNIPKEKLFKNERRKFTTRDGETIYGYLTKPKQKIKKLFVYVHGGPYGVRDFDEFDPFEQYLVSKGAAVLKVNFRGSGGFGQDKIENAYKEWGGMLLNDVADATIATQKELGLSRDETCAVGASYGGYAALTLAYKHGNIYECVAGGMGVYDMKILRDGSDESIYTYQDDYFEIAEDFWGSDEEQHIDFSPVYNADKMKSRILMWHGLQDPISPIMHLDLMKEALEKNNVEYKSFTMSRLGHTFGREEDMRAHFPVIKDFLFE